MSDDYQFNPELLSILPRVTFKAAADPTCEEMSVVVLTNAIPRVGEEVVINYDVDWPRFRVISVRYSILDYRTDGNFDSPSDIDVYVELERLEFDASRMGHRLRPFDSDP